MDQKARARAVDFVLQVMSDRGVDVTTLSHQARVDPGTLRTFLDGQRWPWAKSRAAIEEALGIPSGAIELAARGILQEREGDPVERAIEASRLTRANKHKLIAAYIDLLDQQEGVRGA